MATLRFVATAAAMVIFPAAVAGALTVYVADLVLGRDEESLYAQMADEAESWLRSLYDRSPT